MKQCTKCGQLKPTDQFQIGHNRCIVCRDEYMRAWQDQNRDKINRNQREYQTTIKGRASVLLNAARKRANAKGEPIILTLDDVIKGISGGHCIKTLFPFDMKLSRNGEYRINPFAPSIDKKEPTGIYEPSNVQYVCAWYNLAKGAMTEHDLVMFCKRVADLYS